MSGQHEENRRTTLKVVYCYSRWHMSKMACVGCPLRGQAKDSPSGICRQDGMEGRGPLVVILGLEVLEKSGWSLREQHEQHTIR